MTVSPVRSRRAGEVLESAGGSGSSLPPRRRRTVCSFVTIPTVASALHNDWAEIAGRRGDAG